MSQPMIDRSKLDHPLNELLRTGGLAQGETIPVIVTSKPDRLANVVALVEGKNGKIRTTLDRLGAVSAWLSLSAIGELSVHCDVSELEMTQPTRIATGA